MAGLFLTSAVKILASGMARVPAWARSSAGRGARPLGAEAFGRHLRHCRLGADCLTNALSRDGRPEPEVDPMTDTVLIIDFGSQVTQLIARRVREAGVYSEIAPFNKAEEAIARLKPKAIILSGGPASVLDKDAPLPPMSVYEAGVPVLGICYGEQAMAHQLGGKVEGEHNREFGRAFVEVDEAGGALRRRLEAGRAPPGVDEPRRPRDGAARRASRSVGTSENAPFAMIADEERKLYAIQFHPEVVHTPDGAKLLANFVHNVAGLQRRLDDGRLPRPGDRRASATQVGKGRVICGLSGGVDSAVAARPASTRRSATSSPASSSTTA